MVLDDISSEGDTGLLTYAPKTSSRLSRGGTRNPPPGIGCDMGDNLPNPPKPPSPKTLREFNPFHPRESRIPLVVGLAGMAVGIFVAYSINQHLSGENAVYLHMLNYFAFGGLGYKTFEVVTSRIMNVS